MEFEREREKEKNHWEMFLKGECERGREEREERRRVENAVKTEL